MWIVTGGKTKSDPAVFLSVVQHWKKPDTLIVRARDRKSLKWVADYAQKAIQHTPVNHDYPYRVQIDKGAFSSIVSRMVMQIDYHNVKDRVTKTRGEHWHNVLMRVWAALRGLTPVKADPVLARDPNQEWEDDFEDRIASNYNNEGPYLGDKGNS